ncbi:MAG: 4a-hydroxytetrahydrobiopterin dehydratase [Patescibacteria group bacterium]
MNNLSTKHCVPCEGGVAPLTREQVDDLRGSIGMWDVSEDIKKLSHIFTFTNFVEAMQFVDKVADIAESEGHHPDIHISYNKVTLELSTHAIGGLSENDFILAAKIDTIAPVQ